MLTTTWRGCQTLHDEGFTQHLVSTGIHANLDEADADTLLSQTPLPPRHIPLLPIY